MNSKVEIKNILYPIWKKIGYTRWNYKLFRIWSWVGIKMGYSEQVIKDYELNKRVKSGEMIVGDKKMMYLENE